MLGGVPWQLWVLLVAVIACPYETDAAGISESSTRAVPVFALKDEIDVINTHLRCL